MLVQTLYITFIGVYYRILIIRITLLVTNNHIIPGTEYSICNIEKDKSNK